MPLRYLALFVVGACLGALVNLAIYRLAYIRRRISPWGRPHAGATRSWSDRLPIFGWIGLRREEPLHGRGFWVRPMLLELVFALGVAALYWWEIERLAINVWLPLPGLRPRSADELAVIHWQFAAHLVLITFMAMATFIDIDEQTVPDAITIPGTIAALMIAVLCQSPVLPDLWVDLENPQPAELVTPLSFDYPAHATAFLESVWSLAAALACIVVWCFALLPRHWRRGVGVRKAVRVMVRRIAARPEWRWTLPIALAGSIGIAITWASGGDPWRNLVSSLVGLAVGGGMVWGVRLAGGAMLGREAMGFGDVTLMAMIGAFLGWQAVLIAFFLAPLAGLAVGVLQFLLHGENVMPYGPFLCLATLVVVLFWAPIWDAAGQYFEAQWLVPSAIAVCAPVLILLLFGMRWLRERRALS